MQRSPVQERLHSAAECSSSLAASRHGSGYSRFSNAERRHERGRVGKISLLIEKKTQPQSITEKKG